jgi:hypothetical protein
MWLAGSLIANAMGSAIAGSVGSGVAGSVAGSVASGVASNALGNATSGASAPATGAPKPPSSGLNGLLGGQGPGQLATDIGAPQWMGNMTDQNNAGNKSKSKKAGEKSVQQTQMQGMNLLQSLMDQQNQPMGGGFNSLFS